MKKSCLGRMTKGCFGFLAIIFLTALAISLYSLCWIPAVFVLIYCLVSKKYWQYRLRNSVLCVGVIVTSLILFAVVFSQDDLESVTVEWDKTEFNVGEDTEIEITPQPSDAEIDTLVLSDNDIATLDYEDGKAIITFEKEGSANLYFTANDIIDSSTQKITVIDREKQEAEEKKKAEELKKQQEQEEKERQEALEEQQREEEEKQAEQEQTEQESNDDPIVYITNTGSKYHTAYCRTLRQSKIETHLSEVKGIYGPCGICNPPQ